jgi:aspartate/methionine/tyrosine aminotransferase
MRYARMPIEVESPEEYGYGNIRYNLSESSITDLSLDDLKLSFPNLKLLYGEHRGSEPLRALIAADGNAGSPQEGEALTAADVLIASGAAGALFMIHTALLGPDDHLVVVKPNYGTNLETPRALACEATHIALRFETDFRIDVAEVAAAITPKTRLISITTPHNPTGVMCTAAELRLLVELARKHGCRLLVDETYRDLSLDGATPLAASLGSHVISVASLSKAYGAPGLRLGWAITRDRQLQEMLLAAKEQMSICGSVIDEWVGEQILTRRAELLEATQAEMRRRRKLVAEWMAGEELLEWVAPQGGVVCFPRMRSEPVGGTDAFYRRLLEKHGAYVGPGHWFEMPDTYFRLGYGWPTRDELEAGLQAISKALRG